MEQGEEGVTLMSSDNTKIVSLYSLNHTGSTSPLDDSGARKIEGTLLTFSDRQYFAGGSKYRKELAIGTRLVVLAIRSGWKHWRDKRVVAFITETDDGRYPTRRELGHTDESQWERGPDGKPIDPLQNSREILLIDPSTYAVYTFCTSAAGGRSSVDDLDNAMRNARRIRPEVVPLVSLESQEMPTRYGMKSRPLFRILDWSVPSAEVTTIAPPDDPTAA
jgi:hypothetical protein